MQDGEIFILLVKKNESENAPLYNITHREHFPDLWWRMLRMKTKDPSVPNKALVECTEGMRRYF